MSKYSLSIFKPGFTAVNWYFGLNNLEHFPSSDGSIEVDSAGLHRSVDPGIGAFTNYYNIRSVATWDILLEESYFLVMASIGLNRVKGVRSYTYVWIVISPMWIICFKIFLTTPPRLAAITPLRKRTMCPMSRKSSRISCYPASDYIQYSSNVAKNSSRILRDAHDRISKSSY